MGNEVFICSNPDDEVYPWEAEGWSHEQARDCMDQLSDEVGDWQGIPIPLGEDLPLRLHAKHPLREVFDASPSIEIVVGGPEDPEQTGNVDEDVARAIERACSADDTDWSGERIVNRWYDASHNREVLVFKRGDGTAFAVTVPRAPDSSMDRLDLWLKTMMASDAWDVGAETKAMEKLLGLVSERQMRHYMLTGAFLETSARSGLTYIFRRLRPTIVLSSKHKWWSKLAATDSMRCIAVLCMHPIGYYDQTWAGCMVPTDDVISHLLHMRADEAYFWRKANHHDPASAEAGL